MLASLFTALGLTSDSPIALFVYLHAILMIASGALVIANVRMGGFLMAITMCVQAITVDNPFLTTSEQQWNNSLLNLLKDLSVVAVSLLIYSRKPRIIHRRDLLREKQE